MDAYKNVVRGGGLKLKGGKKKKNKKRGLDAAALVELAPAAPAEPAAPAAAARDDGLTETERAHKRRLVARRKEAAASGTAKSHRERVDELNNKLSTMTEHNDIPRISAAGNG